MKKIIVTTVFFLISLIGNSQKLTNGSLSGYCTGNGFSMPSCIQGWAASHGTPTVLGNLNNNKWAWLSISKENSNGIYTNYDFTAGKTYEISFKIKAYTTIESNESKTQNPTVIVRATSDLTTASSEKSPKIATESQVIWSKEVSAPKAYWQIIKMTYIPTKNNSQIWFYPTVQNQLKLNDGSKLEMEIDDIEIKAITETALSNFQDINSNTAIENDYIVSNPVFKGYVSKIFTNAIEVTEISLLDLSGYNKKITYTIIDEKTINFIIDEATSEGIYTLKITTKDGKTAIKKIIVQ